MLSPAERSAEWAAHEARVSAALAESQATDAALELLHGGIVAPLTTLTMPSPGVAGSFDGGVYHGSGAICQLGNHIKQSFVNRPRPLDELDTSQHLAGCHLFGGMLKNEHFGHFMVESLARVWAANFLAHESIIFHLRIPNAPVPRCLTDVFDLLLPGKPIRILHQPTRIEQLWVPEQLAHPKNGFIYGHPSIRQMFTQWRDIRGRDFRRIYVSRSKLERFGGNVLGEKLLERELQKEGYIIFHPQDHALVEQLAVYNGARQIIFCEGSAIHLYATIARPDQQVYILRRRRLSMVFDWQIISFGGRRAAGSVCIEATYYPEARANSWDHSKLLLNFDALRDDLLQAGFIEARHWMSPTESELAEHLAELSKGPMVRHPFH